MQGVSSVEDTLFLIIREKLLGGKYEEKIVFYSIAFRHNCI